MKPGTVKRWWRFTLIQGVHGVKNLYLSNPDGEAIAHAEWQFSRTRGMVRWSRIRARAHTSRDG